MQFRIHNRIKQDPLITGLKQPHKSPMQLHLPWDAVNTVFGLPNHLDDMDPQFILDPIHDSSKPSQLDEMVPDSYPESVDASPPNVDSSKFDFPWPPSVNSTIGLQYPSSSAIMCPFEYRSLRK
jgi:hypothetical protein